ncbi:ferrous iron transport protein B [Desulfarculus baarsii DSM 2075]|uniref:Ferrous iron transport protein B n=1 Tax=Desulfarculus baarsii (strain ATCC 33931 / DSM 2075 / LMG 7858 / VKM B-1802 / 2st14) TaxID=644282 RepID=E1QG21_DESB2|nr:ferrous iron transport protein B [Desulfarculus baarsii]ADK84631.1 ferrous iron transport protein B [Desulfarculus baarsii DSM 2075]
MTEKRGFTVALAGNPNSGKTSMFNALTGARQHVGNYPGVTVEKKWGQVRHGQQTIEVVDLPGTYSLTAYSLEEVVARNFIIQQRPDVIIDVVDAANLERNLYLAVQFMELGAPLVIALNMIDVAEARGLQIDVAKLSQLLGVPVVPTVARGGKGMKELLDAAAQVAAERKEWKPLELSYGHDVDQALAKLVENFSGQSLAWGPLSPRWVGVKLLEGDEEVIRQVGGDPGLADKLEPLRQKLADHIAKTADDDPAGVISDGRYGYIGGVYRQAVRETRARRLELSDKIDKVLTNRLIGPLFLLAVLYGVYEFVFWASEAPVAWLEGLIGWLGGAAEATLPDGFVRSLVVSGVIDGVGGVLGFVPLIMFMFLAIAFMEDTGYLARVAFLVDRVLRGFGLHGNSVMAMIVSGGISGGCAVPGVMATRTLKDPKARLATILTVPMMNCGAKLPVYALLISAFFAAHQAQMMFALTLVSWSIALLAARLLRWTVLRGEAAPFVMELPPYRLPTWRGLAIHTWERTWQYIKKAGTVILGISIVMWAMMSFPGLPEEQAAQWEQKVAAAASDEAKATVEQDMAQAQLAHSLAGRIGQGLDGLMSPLGFDWRTNVALVGGFAAKEVVVATLGTAYSMGEVDPEETEGLAQRLAREPGWGPLKAMALMIFVMIYAPCFVTVAVIKKEAGSWKWALFSVAYTTALAYVLALAVYRGGMALGLG